MSCPGATFSWVVAPRFLPKLGGPDGLTAVENQLWAAAVVQRVAKRVHWDPPEDIVKLVSQAATEPDQKKQAELWIEWQKKVVDEHCTTEWA